MMVTPALPPLLPPKAMRPLPVDHQALLNVSVVHKAFQLHVYDNVPQPVP